MDWKLTITLTVIIFNAIVFITIKFNDIRHLIRDSEEIKKKIDKIFRRLGKVEKAQVRRDAICDERHDVKKLRRGRKK